MYHLYCQRNHPPSKWRKESERELQTFRYSLLLNATNSLSNYTLQKHQIMQDYFFSLLSR